MSARAAKTKPASPPPSGRRLRRSPKLSAPEIATKFRALVAACAASVAGLEACARHAHDAALKRRVSDAAAGQRTAADELLSLAHAHGVECRTTPPTGERLRWEWLASTAGILDGAPDVRLFEECKSSLERACDTIRTLEGGVGDAAAVTLCRLRERLEDALAVVASGTTLSPQPAA